MPPASPSTSTTSDRVDTVRDAGALGMAGVVVAVDRRAGAGPVRVRSRSFIEALAPVVVPAQGRAQPAPVRDMEAEGAAGAGAPRRAPASRSPGCAPRCRRRSGAASRRRSTRPKPQTLAVSGALPSRVRTGAAPARRSALRVGPAGARRPGAAASPGGPGSSRPRQRLPRQRCHRRRRSAVRERRAPILRPVADRGARADEVGAGGAQVGLAPTVGGRAGGRERGHPVGLPGDGVGEIRGGR